MKFVNGIRKNIAARVMGIGLGLAGLIGCEIDVSLPKYQTIEGRPLSVKREDGYMVGIFRVDGRDIIAYLNSFANKSTDMSALIQAEIDDGDEESVKLFGKYVKEGEYERFNIYSMKVGEYKFDFSNTGLSENPFDAKTEKDRR